MRSLVPILPIIVLVVSAWPAGACGDKLLVLGRGVPFQVGPAEFPASILFYVNPNSPGSKKVEFTHLQAIMRDAGHRFLPVTGREERFACLHRKRFVVDAAY